MTAGRGLCQVDSMREPEMTIPPIEYLTAANVRRLSDPKVMGFGAYRHPYTDDAGAASVAQALACLPEHWKATPICVAFSRLFAIDRTETLRRGDVVEGRRIEERRDPAEVTGIEVLLSCGGARWWTYISRGEIDEFGETGALRRRIVECDDHDFPRDPRTHRHTPPDAVGLWRLECGSYPVDGSPRTATYRHSETGHRVTVSSDIGADFTADVHQALADLKPPTALTARGHNMLARVFRQSVDDIIRSGTHGSAEEVRETIREIAPHLALVANMPEDWRQAAGMGSRTGSDHLGPSEHLREWQMGRVDRIYASDPMIPGAPYARIKSEIMDRHPRGDWYKLPPEFDQRERGPGIAHVRGIEPRPVATVGYDDPTGDDVAADWRRS